MRGGRQAGIRGSEVVPLLEREAQLAALGEYAAEARQGDGRLVLIAGEAGVGKSALAEHMQRGLISVKTVGHHVSAVLAKLDAPSRGVAAARATQLGLVAAVS
jgi:ATP/maltotriose-dependent transcriptional regulator MalT